MAKNFVMSHAILELLQENSGLSGKEVYGELKKRYPGEKINENSALVAFSHARRKLGLRMSLSKSMGFTEAEVAMIKEKGEQMGLGVGTFVRMIVITYLRNPEMLPGFQWKSEGAIVNRTALPNVRPPLQTQRAQAAIKEKLQSIISGLTGMTEISGSEIKRWAGSQRHGDKVIASLIESGHLTETGRNTSKGSPIYTVARINPNDGN